MNPVSASPWASLIPIVAIFLIFYFLLIRPQVRQERQHKKMLAGLKKGDRVLTTGGIYGTITGLKGSDLELKVADNVKLLVSRSAVARLAPEGGAEQAGGGGA